jgi:holo-[acyl-carrier protein] synthase
MGESRLTQPRGIVVGHGVDVVDLDDFSRLLKAPARDHLDRHFTKVELADAGDGIRQLERLAGRFAVKEAVMKALGVGWGDGIAFTDVEVVTLPSGAPSVSLRRQLLTLAQSCAISGWLISISHTNTIVVASVIAVGNPH